MSIDIDLDSGVKGQGCDLLVIILQYFRVRIVTYIPRYCQVEDQGSGLWVLIQPSLKFGLWTICFDTAVTWMSIVTYGP